MHLEFRHLRMLLTVAESGSIRKAAARLQLSQPATSAQLKRIEHELGGPLFVRSADGVTPNENGQYVLRCARDLVAGFDRLREHARSAAEADKQAAAPLRAGGTAGPLVSLLVAALFELVPERRLSIDARRSVHTLVKLLSLSKCDIAVFGEFPGFPLPVGEWVATRTLLREPVFVLLAEDHPLACQKAVSLHELAGEDWVMPEADESGMHAYLHLTCQSAGFTPRIAHVTPDLSVAQLLVAGRRAVCGVWPTAEVSAEGTVQRPLVDVPLYRRLLLAWNTESVPPELADAAYEGLLAAYLSLVRQRPRYLAWWEGGGEEFALGGGM
ncbi:LysR family transcriptional regulator [Streptomyces actinomycinicus]|uniref:LysR family transcriptional regulator n=1 Tax=Streptomyces actinomycinicus TaxID=1695166 RepID=A0A937EKL4_9ACTN|nr:LysR family transcriptional regulator [Streptomyces actinomycinicus]MBL1083779.1 LysR family transcriptional regulator [Streptomyces actinomycinicus]